MAEWLNGSMPTGEKSFWTVLNNRDIRIVAVSLSQRQHNQGANALQI
jgi:hypothetical protein